MTRWFLLFAAALLLAPATAADAPYTIAPHLFDMSRPDDLGLKPPPGVQTFTIFRPGEGTDLFVNGVVLLGFKGRLYAQWQSSALHEDTPDTHVVYAASEDGAHWSAPIDIVPRDGVMRSSGGWWTDGKILVAYLNVWPKGFNREAGGYVDYITSRDGRQLAAQSCDRGATWTTPVLTQMPDSRAKQSAGNLPDGTAFLVNAPAESKVRSPLVVTLSKDGWRFDRAFLLRAGPPLAPHSAGTFKRGGYHYPKSVIWNGALWVGYADAKEQAVVARVPLAALR